MLNDVDPAQVQSVLLLLLLLFTFLSHFLSVLLKQAVYSHFIMEMQQARQDTSWSGSKPKTHT